MSAPWHSGKCCKALWDMGTPPVDRQMEGQTRVKTLPSRRTTYASGKNRGAPVPSVRRQYSVKLENYIRNDNSLHERSVK